MLEQTADDVFRIRKTISRPMTVVVTSDDVFRIEKTASPSMTVVVTSDDVFRIGKMTCPPDNKAWTPSTPTVAGWLIMTKCPLRTKRTFSEICLTLTSAGQRLVHVLFLAEGQRSVNDLFLM